jgi:hypothetical protein
MKKHLAGAALVAAVIAAAPMAQAQSTSSTQYGISGGLTLPVGGLGDVSGSGLNIQGHISTKPTSSGFTLRGDAALWTLGGKTVNRNGVSFSTDGSTLFSLNGNVVYPFEGAKDATFVPYVIGGGGLYFGNNGFGTKFGVNAGGGITFKLAGFDAFTEARFHNVFTTGGSSRIIPVSFGILFRP